jgi:hypothetical protein
MEQRGHRRESITIRDRKPIAALIVQIAEDGA